MGLGGLFSRSKDKKLKFAKRERLEVSRAAEVAARELRDQQLWQEGGTVSKGLWFKK